MPPKNNQDSTVVLVWSDGMIAIILRLLEEQHDLGKRGDTGFKPEAWNIFREGIQSEYTGTGYISKLRKYEANYVEYKYELTVYSRKHDGMVGGGYEDNQE